MKGTILIPELIAMRIPTRILAAALCAFLVPPAFAAAEPVLPREALGGTREIPWSYKQKPPAKVSVDGDGVYTVANVRWGFDERKDEQGRNLPKWRTVKIDPRGAVRAYFALKLFAPEWLAAHGLLIYKFDPKSPVVTEHGETSKGFAVSVEAYLKEGQKYDLMKGLKKSWPNVWQLSSLEDYVQLCALAGQRMIIYELELTPDQVRRMLALSLEESFKDHAKDYYNTLSNSCFTNQIKMINAVIPEGRRIRDYLIPKVVINPFASLPRTLGFLLKRHDLLRGKPIPFAAKERGKADLATKELTGAARQEALRRLAPLTLQSAKLENLLVNAVREGALPLPVARILLWDEVSRYSPWLHVPGTVPGEANNGEVSLGEKWGADLAAAGSADVFGNVVRMGFDAYREGLKRRILLEGPDISGFVGNRLSDFERRAAELLKTAQLHAR